ncbi:hypothetical protein MP638_005015 [Amoeboaphelidium occidentale]|nr:hypothetical protein MP638_005015 [Amoeboaphelidium occidentale]
MFLVGFLASFLGNCVIGAGQCLQKYGLNRLEDEDKKLKLKRSRVNSSHWLAGIALVYFGEMFGNWVGLSLASAAVITPLGIVSVLVNAILASKFLGEKIDKKQQEGYGYIILGVFMIILVAPKKDGQIISGMNNITAWLQFLDHSNFIMVVLILLFGALIAVYQLIVSKKQSIYNFVVTAALFASINVITSKTISLYFRASVLQQDTIKNDDDLTPSRSALFVLFSTLILSIIGQEVFRQQAYGKFNVSQFQPLLYACFNVLSVISNEVVFKELESGFTTRVTFYSVFMGGIFVIYRGSMQLQHDQATEKSKV